MKFLIAGFGSIGRRHLRNLRALGETDILLYRTHHSTLPDDELRGLTVETDLAKALSHKPDAVVVANPTALHLDVAIPVAEAGCSILMEKPVADTLERVDDLKAALKRGGGKLLVGFQFRFHPGLQKAKTILDSGTIGRPVSATVLWGEYLPNWHPWEDYRQGYAARRDLGGGVVITLTHPLDYLRWLLGDAASVSAQVGTLGDLGIDVEDLADINIRYASGCFGNVHLNYLQQPPVHRMQIVGTGGTLDWDNADGAVRVFSAVDGKMEHYPLPDGFERNDLFLAETRHFIQVVKGLEEPVCSLEDGIAALRMARAVYESSAAEHAVRLLG